MYNRGACALCVYDTTPLHYAVCIANMHQFQSKNPRHTVKDRSRCGELEHTQVTSIYTESVVVVYVTETANPKTCTKQNIAAWTPPLEGAPE